MNSIATLRRTEPQITAELLARFQTVLGAIIFTLLLVSFKPFATAGNAKQTLESGDLVNQLGFGVIGLVSVFSMLFLVNGEVLKKLVSPWWWLMFAFAFISVTQSFLPTVAFRALLFTLMAIAGMLAVLTVPSGASGFQKALVIGAIIVLGMSYAGLVLYPTIAKHTTFSREPEHSGLWRGLYTHKNIAGPVMASITFIGIYAFRRGSWLVGLGLIAGGLLFVMNTGSKTSALLVPLVIALVTIPGIFGVRRLAATIVFMTIFVFIIASIGTVLFAPLGELREYIKPGMTFTGRTEIWKFGIENIALRPFFGYGYESFWLTPYVTSREVSFEATWDVRGIIHGHNGYLDIAINMGIPALFVAVFAMIVEPVRNYARCINSRENILMADLFMMIYTFTALNACLESFFFRRADPVWLLFVFAVFGLRLTSRFVVPSKASA